MPEADNPEYDDCEAFDWDAYLTQWAGHFRRRTCKHIGKQLDAILAEPGDLRAVLKEYRWHIFVESLR